MLAADDAPAARRKTKRGKTAGSRGGHGDDEDEVGADEDEAGDATPVPPPQRLTPAKAKAGAAPRPASCEAGTSVTPMDFLSPHAARTGRRLAPSPPPAARDDPAPPQGGGAAGGAGVSLETFHDAGTAKALFAPRGAAEPAAAPAGKPAAGAPDLAVVAVDKAGPAAAWARPRLELPSPAAHLVAEPGWLEAWLGDEVLGHKQWCLEHAQWRRGAELGAVWSVLVVSQQQCEGDRRRGSRTRRARRPRPPPMNLRIFGSMISGLALPSSDVDVILEGASPKDFHATAVALRQCEWVQSCKEIPAAAVPVIKVLTTQRAVQGAATAAPPPATLGAAAATADPASPSRPSLPGIPQALARSVLDTKVVQGAAAASAASASALASAATVASAASLRDRATSRSSSKGTRGGRGAPLPPGEVQRSDGEWPVHIDVTLLTPMHRGLLTTEFAINSVAAVPALAPLVLFFKQVLRAGGLHDTASGGLPSYAALVIVRAFLESPAAVATAALHGSAKAGPVHHRPTAPLPAAHHAPGVPFRPASAPQLVGVPAAGAPVPMPGLQPPPVAAAAFPGQPHPAAQALPSVPARPPSVASSSGSAAARGPPVPGPWAQRSGADLLGGSAATAAASSGSPRGRGGSASRTQARRGLGVALDDGCTPAEVIQRAAHATSRGTRRGAAAGRSGRSPGAASDAESDAASLGGSISDAQPGRRTSVDQAGSAASSPRSSRRPRRGKRAGRSTKRGGTNPSSGPGVWLRADGRQPGVAATRGLMRINVHPLHMTTDTAEDEEEERAAEAEAEARLAAGVAGGKPRPSEGSHDESHDGSHDESHDMSRDDDDAPSSASGGGGAGRGTSLSHGPPQAGTTGPGRAAHQHSRGHPPRPRSAAADDAPGGSPPRVRGAPPPSPGGGPGLVSSASSAPGSPHRVLPVPRLTATSGLLPAAHPAPHGAPTWAEGAWGPAVAVAGGIDPLAPPAPSGVGSPLRSRADAGRRASEGDANQAQAAAAAAPPAAPPALRPPSSGPGARVVPPPLPTHSSAPHSDPTRGHGLRPVAPGLGPGSAPSRPAAQSASSSHRSGHASLPAQPLAPFLAAPRRHLGSAGPAAFIPASAAPAVVFRQQHLPPGIPAQPAPGALPVVIGPPSGHHPTGTVGVLPLPVPLLPVPMPPHAAAMPPVHPDGAGDASRRPRNTRRDRTTKRIGRAEPVPGQAPSADDAEPARLAPLHPAPEHTRNVGAQTSLPARAVGAMALGLLRFVAEDLDPRRVVVALPQSVQVHLHFNPAAIPHVGVGTPGGAGPLIPRDCGLLQSSVLEDPVVVLDPLDPSLTSNVARSCFRFPQVRNLCRDLHARLAALTPVSVTASALLSEETLAASEAVPRARAEPPRRVTGLQQRFPVLAEALGIRPGPPPGEAPAVAVQTASTPRG